MDVYLVAVGPDRYECYYEAAEQEEADEPVEGRGFFARMKREVQRAVEGRRARAPSESDRRAQDISRPHAEAQHALDRGAHRRAAPAVASAQGRHGDAARVGRSGRPPRPRRSCASNLKWDADHHRNRLILHTLALIAAVPVALVPGPNVLGYLFTFTVVGHFLAWRGAVQRAASDRVDDRAEPGADRPAARVFARRRCPSPRDFRRRASPSHAQDGPFRRADGGADRVIFSIL